MHVAPALDEPLAGGHGLDAAAVPVRLDEGEGAAADADQHRAGMGVPPERAAGVDGDRRHEHRLRTLGPDPDPLAVGSQGRDRRLRERRDVDAGGPGRGRRRAVPAERRRGRRGADEREHGDGESDALHDAAPAASAWTACVVSARPPMPQSPLWTSSTRTQVTPRMFSPSTATIASVSPSTIWRLLSSLNTPSMTLT